MKNFDLVIGIDPDVDKCGLAVYDVRMKLMEPHKLTFPSLLEYLRWTKGEVEKDGSKWMVYVEAGWMNKSNWHVDGNMGAYYSAAIGASVGQNQGVGMKIIEMCKYYDIPCEGIRPLPKTMRIGNKRLNIWKGRDGKITQEELLKVLKRNGISPIGRSNQDERDAVLIALDGAGCMVL